MPRSIQADQICQILFMDGPSELARDDAGMLVFQPKHQEIRKHGEAHFLGSQRRRCGKHRALDLAGLERSKLSRLIAQLKNRHILVCVQAVFIERIARYTDGFAFELIRPCDASFRVELECQGVDYSRDNNDVSAAQVL